MTFKKDTPEFVMLNDFFTCLCKRFGNICDDDEQWDELMRCHHEFLERHKADKHTSILARHLADAFINAMGKIYKENTKTTQG